MTAVDHALPPGARPLGIRVKPAMSIAIGMRDPTKKPPVWAIDHFRASDQTSEEGLRFHAVYGEKPTELDDLRLPGSREMCLEIRYRAFKGGQDGPGVLVALGLTNFGVMEYAGGPDTLQVWNQDGTVVYAETAGLDAITGEPLDELARELGLELQTTFKFMIPKVLPLGAFAVVRTQSKESTDSLHFHTATWYGLFGAKVPFVLRPTLVLKPTTMRPVIQTKDGPKRIVKEAWALDLRLPETEEAMLARGRELLALTAGDLYGTPSVGGDGGTPRPALGSGSPDDVPADGGDVLGNVADNPGAGVAVSPPAPASLPGEPDDDPEPSEDEIKTLALRASKVKVHFGRKEGRSLGQVYEQGGAAGWFKWLLTDFEPQSAEDDRVQRAGWAFCRHALKGIYQEALGMKETT